MANAEVLKIKMIAALLEGIDQDDAKDAELAIKTIRVLLDAAERKG